MSTTVVSLLRNFIGTSLVITLSISSALAGNTLKQQLFLDAEAALENEDQPLFLSLKKRLGNYALVPYLDYQVLSNNLSIATDKEISHFLKKYKGTPVADLLYRKWLDHLGKNKKWASLLRFYTPQGNIRRRCQYLNALIQTNSSNKAWPEITKVWLHGKSRPSACDPVFKAWEQAGKRNDKLTWERIHLTLKAGKWRLAQHLGKKLNKKDHLWLERWITIHKNPRAVLKHKNFTGKHPYRETMLSYAVRRMAKFDGIEALRLWQQIKPRYNFTKNDDFIVKRRISLALERNDSDIAYSLIRDIKAPKKDHRLLAAKLHAGLLRQDWSQVLADLKQWPSDAKTASRWRYWHARALEGIGKVPLAIKAYKTLAKERGYFGFLAADRSNSPYHLNHTTTFVNATDTNKISRDSGIKRALELHDLNRDLTARREWLYATKPMSKDELKAAAKIAQRANWFDQAIFTLAKTKYWEDLVLRFPIEYQTLVNKNASRHQIDGSWIYAVMRQESAFMRDARSPVGASGLMQLMPATANEVALSLNQQKPSKSSITQPKVNIALGSAYLKQLSDKLSSNPVLATAAYNAGPHRVDKWLPKNTLPADIWVDLVPFTETRRYIRRVMSYRVIYDKRLGKKTIRLKQHMDPIKGTIEDVVSG